jgi:adenylate kinase
MDLILITGSPGSGKTTIAKILSKRLKVKVISLTEFILKTKIFEEAEGEKSVEIKKLQKSLEKELNKLKDEKLVIVEGHLACELILKKYNTKVIVLRRSLKKLKKEMEKRGYSKKKISDNLILEAIDYFGENSRSRYKKVYEIFVKDKKTTINKILKILKGKKIDETQYANKIEKKEFILMLQKKEIQLV